MSAPHVPDDPSIGSNGFDGFDGFDGFADPGFGHEPDDGFDTPPRRRPLRQVVGAIIAAAVLLIATLVARPILTDPPEPDRSPVPTPAVPHAPPEEVPA